MYRHLRCRTLRRKRYSTYSRRGQLPERISIAERPVIVEARRRLGDWEGDTVIGHAHQGALRTLVERKSRYTLIAPLANKRAGTAERAIIAALGSHRGKTRTLTVDNGREFAAHRRIAKALGAPVYFAHPYNS